jgi:hypothetical protein
MPLSLPALSSGLADGFARPAADAAGCAAQWADAVKSHATAIVPASATVEAAAAALEGQLAEAFSAPSAISGMESAFAAFAAAVGGGMAGWTPVPPPGPVGFAAHFAQDPPPATHSDAAGEVASLVDTWMKTGSATLIAPPFTVTNWT